MSLRAEAEFAEDLGIRDADQHPGLRSGMAAYVSARDAHIGALFGTVARNPV